MGTMVSACTEMPPSRGPAEDEPVPTFLALENPSVIDVPTARPLLASRAGFAVSLGSSRDAIELSGGKLLVRVRARAVDGQANDAVITLVAKALGLAPSRLRLLRGSAAREKLLQVTL